VGQKSATQRHMTLMASAFEIVNGGARGGFGFLHVGRVVFGKIKFAGTGFQNRWHA